VEEIKDWRWRLQTDKGEFFITVVGHWSQEEAATLIRAVFHVILKLIIIAMIPRKRSTGPDEIQCTVCEQQENRNELGFDFFAGKKVWEAIGRGVEFEAELIRQKMAITADTVERLKEENV